MSVSLSLLGGAGAQFFDDNGNPLSGGKLYTYAAGTTTPAVTYTSLAGNIANTNPIILDAAGRTPSEIWLTNAVLYKFVLKTSNEVLIGTYDNISSSGFYEDLRAALAASSGASLVGFIQSGTGAVATTVQAKLRQIVSVMDFGAVGDGVADDAQAVSDALASLGTSGGTLYFPRVSAGYKVSVFNVPNDRVTIDLNGNTLYCDDINLIGDNITFDLGNGVVDGLLKYSTVAVGGGGVAGGTSITVNDASVFQIGDTIQSSYGLGSDGNDPIPITNIVGNTLYFAQLVPAGLPRAGLNALTGTLPANAVVGNWVWGAIFSVTGQNCRIVNGNVTKSKAYVYAANGPSLIVEKLNVSNNGLDMFEIKNSGGTVQMNYCYFGNILDAAKSGFAISGFDGNLILTECAFARDNSDGDFFLYGTGGFGNIKTIDCVFNGNNTTHPAPYNYDAFTSCYVAQNNGERFGNIQHINAKFTNYSQTVIQTPSSTTDNRILGSVEYTNCQIFSGFAKLQLATTSQFTVNNCTFGADAPAATHIINDDLVSPLYNNCTFLGDTTIKRFYNAFLQDCVFKNCSGVGLYSNSIMRGGALIETSVGPWPTFGWAVLRMQDVAISNSQYGTGTFANIINVQPGGQANVGSVRLLNGTFEVVPYCINNVNTYCYVKGYYHSTSLYGLWNDDWYIPSASRFQSVSGGAEKVVNKSNVATLTANAVAGATSINVFPFAGIAGSDFINILCDSGRVHVTTVASVSGGTTITITDAIPAGEVASTNQPVCAFTWA